MKSFIKIMKALSDPNRVRVIKLLALKELCACEIQDLLGLAQPTVSRHMKILEDAGLVYARKEGVWLYYRQARIDNSYAGTLLAHLENWLNEDPVLEKMILSLQSDGGARLCSTREKK